MIITFTQLNISIKKLLLEYSFWIIYPTLWIYALKPVIQKAITSTIMLTVYGHYIKKFESIFAVHLGQSMTALFFPTVKLWVSPESNVIMNLLL